MGRKEYLSRLTLLIIGDLQYMSSRGLRKVTNTGSGQLLLSSRRPRALGTGFVLSALRYILVHWWQVDHTSLRSRFSFGVPMDIEYRFILRNGGVSMTVALSRGVRDG